MNSSSGSGSCVDDGGSSCGNGTLKTLNVSQVFLVLMGGGGGGGAGR